MAYDEERARFLRLLAGPDDDLAYVRVTDRQAGCRTLARNLRVGDRAIWEPGAWDAFTVTAIDRAGMPGMAFTVSGRYDDGETMRLGLVALDMVWVVSGSVRTLSDVKDE